MFKLMIVDDDALMCNQIAALVDWEALEIEVVSYALSGQEAIEVLEKEQIDFVLTDMNMPKVTGVELIEYINRNHPGIHVIALSGYDDFYFVRNSLKYGAYDYILKNQLTKEGLERLIKEIKEKSKMKEDLKSHVNLTVDQMTQTFFKRLILRKEFDREQIENIIKNLNIPFNKNCTAVMLIYKNQEIEDEVLNRSLYHMCQQILKEAEFAQMVDLNFSGFCAIVSFRKEISQASCLKKMENWGRSIGTSGKKFFNLNLGVSISDICSDIFRLRQYYQQAKENAEVFFYEEEKTLICAWEVAGRPFAAWQPLSFPAVKQVMELIAEDNYDAVKTLMDDFFENVKRQGGAVSGFQDRAVKWVEKLADKAEEEGIAKEYLFDGKVYTYEDYYNISSVNKWRNLTLKLTEKICRAVSPAAKAVNCHEYTSAALKKIHSQYYEGLTLSEVAESLGISGAYLSRIFKEDMGLGFNEYLTKVRIDHVIEKIQNGEGKMRDVAEKCGFSNYNYFFRVFKEHTGMTPAGYFGSQSFGKAGNDGLPDKL
ncbi:MAG: response regulator [Lachnospiraceae bacterium]